MVIEMRYIQADESLATDFDWLHSKVELREIGARIAPGFLPLLQMKPNWVDLRMHVNENGGQTFLMPQKSRHSMASLLGSATVSIGHS